MLSEFIYVNLLTSMKFDGFEQLGSLETMEEASLKAQWTTDIGQTLSTDHPTLGAPGSSIF